MTEENKIIDAIPNFACCNVVWIAIDVFQVESTDIAGDSLIVYNPIINFYFDLGTDEDPVSIMTITDVHDECPETAASIVYESLSQVYDCVSSYVTSFDTEVKCLGEFDLEDLEDEYIPPTKEVRIENMKNTIIMLQKHLEQLEA